MDIRNLRVHNPDKLLEIMDVSDVLDMTKFVKKFGFTVIRSRIVDDCCLAGGRSNINAYVSVEKNADLEDVREIYVFERNCFEFSRFLIAYMFADYQLHYDENDLSFVSGVFEESIYDRETYRYALDILLPNVLFEREKMDFNFPNFSYLVNKYRVSEYLLKQKILWFQEMNKQKTLRKEIEG